MEQDTDFICSDVQQISELLPAPSVEPCVGSPVVNPRAYRMEENTVQETVAVGPTCIPAHSWFMVLGRLSKQRPDKLV